MIEENKLEEIIRELELIAENRWTELEKRQELWSVEANYYLGWLDALAHLRERLSFPVD